jgi:2-oxoglutarate ferredoxin oxidoreductase subunit beta
MTGGQMAPTSMLGQKTTTSPIGRNSILDGYPIKMSDILAQLPGTVYIERCTVTTPAQIVKTKKAIKKALQYQLDGKGFTMVEILSPCPTNWKMNAVDSCRWIEQTMVKQFPLGVIKDLPAEEKKKQQKGQ